MTAYTDYMASKNKNKDYEPTKIEEKNGSITYRHRFGFKTGSSENYDIVLQKTGQDFTPKDLESVFNAEIALVKATMPMVRPGFKLIGFE